jgi:hypothetical protein
MRSRAGNELAKSWSPEHLYLIPTNKTSKSRTLSVVVHGGSGAATEHSYQ